MNVRINAPGLNDKDFIKKILTEGEAIQSKAMELEREIIEITNAKIAPAH
jgi:formiminotetrahydrofolate cyclodeaminase